MIHHSGAGMKEILIRGIAACLAAVLITTASAESIIRIAPSDDPRISEAVLFAFDAYGLTYRHGLELTLVSGSKKGIVLNRGPAGAADSARIDFYGTVLQIDGKLHMWYRGSADSDPRYFR